MSDILKLCNVIRETGYAIHCYLGPGHFENVYENALLHRLTKQGLSSTAVSCACVRRRRDTAG